MAAIASAQCTLSVSVDVQKVDVWYKLQPSTSAAPKKPEAASPSDWTTTEPTYDGAATNTLYACQKTTLTDGTFYWSDVSKSTSYEAAKSAWNLAHSTSEAFQSMEVGGGNLLGNTENSEWTEANVSVAANTFGSVSPYNTMAAARSVEPYIGGTNAVVFENDTATGNRGVGWYTHPGAMEKDATYTFSCMVKADKAVTVHMHTGWRTSATSSYSGWTSQNSVDIPAGEWTEYTCTFKPVAQAVTTWECIVGICYTGIASGVTVRFAHAKLERGNVATDWSPAPGDMATLAEFLKGRQWYAECSTDAGEVDKTATIVPATTDFTLEVGRSVDVKFSATNTGAVGSLTLNVNGTGAKPIKAQRNDSIANLGHAGVLYQNVIIRFVYNGTYWLATENYNNTYNQAAVSYNQNVKASSDTYVGTHIVMGDSSGYRNVAGGKTFDLGYPLLYYATAASTTIQPGKTANNHYTEKDNVNFSVNGSIESGAAYKTLYLKGQVSGTTFTVADSGYLTTVVPANDNGFCYIPLGVMSSATAGHFSSSKQLFAFKNGLFQDLALAGLLIAENTEQVFWKDADGAHVSTTEGDATVGPNVIIDSDGMDVRDGTDALAHFGETAVIGREDAAHVEIAPSSTGFYGTSGMLVGSISTSGFGRTPLSYRGGTDLSPTEPSLTWTGPYSVAFSLGVATVKVTVQDPDYPESEEETVTFSDYGTKTLTIGPTVTLAETDGVVSLTITNAGLTETQRHYFTLTYTTLSAPRPSYLFGTHSGGRGGFSFGAGFNVEPSGFGSVAMGYQTRAAYEHQAAVGRLNEYNAFYNVFDGVDYAFMVGNGDVDTNTRSNALAVDWNGNLGIGGGIATESSDFEFRIPDYNSIYRRMVFTSIGNLRVDTHNMSSTSYAADSYFVHAPASLGTGAAEDYIVEVGSNSGTTANPQWRWLKFASGYAIAWGYYSDGAWKAEKAWGSLYYNETTRVSNPFTWAGAPYEWMQPRGTSYFWCVNHADATASQTGTYYLMSPTKQTTARAANLNFLQIGRWK